MAETKIEWANLRAIALGLEALRRVDRYGISRRGEQYTGWRALPAGPPGALSVEEACRVILIAAGLAPTAHNVDTLLASPADLQSLYRKAAREAHPDAGGTVTDFQRLQDARRVLTDAAR